MLRLNQVDQADLVHLEDLLDLVYQLNLEVLEDLSDLLVLVCHLNLECLEDQ